MTPGPVPAKAEVFASLVGTMRPFTSALDVRTDQADEYYVDTFHIMKNRKPLFFGAVKIGKRYVSYHLMPVYVEPALLSGTSEALLGRMQGKSCFNFSRPDAGLFEELSRLTQAGLELYRERGYLST